MDTSSRWTRFQTFYQNYKSLGMALDISRMNFSADFFEKHQSSIQQALTSMNQLEKGAIANPDENRMVGHYWLRNADLAPTAEIAKVIRDTVEKIIEFSSSIHHGHIKSQRGKNFSQVLLIGIGGSALGPQFVANALGGSDDLMSFYFFDNTDPDGMNRVLSRIGSRLEETLTLVISKSGGTKETRNGMLIAKAAYARAELNFARHAIAITGEGSELDNLAKEEDWLSRFPMWDWVGGRTSEISAVGLLPAALQGIDIEGLLQGAHDMDEATRNVNLLQNPAALIALMWVHMGETGTTKDLVFLPYKDRLELVSRYLQQLIMESIGKEKNLKGDIVHEGIVVYGNKGSTDQHAYVQQLREGPADFAVTFIEVLKDEPGTSLIVEEDVTSGDYLHSFFMGTRNALYDNARESMTITIDEVSPKTVGALIALFERAVGLYSFMKGINAYHQPGVEAGKKAATEMIAIQRKALAHLRNNPSRSFSVEELARELDSEKSLEELFKILNHLAVNQRVYVEPASTVFGSTYKIKN
ncbi:MAG: glucose-6-phosphate isomerase [SAR324 cluster bacterium]|nr:glucose-6-phosphate isomerase [SAR324 cluster bacterium]